MRYEITITEKQHDGKIAIVATVRLATQFEGEAITFLNRAAAAFPRCELKLARVLEETGLFIETRGATLP